MVTAAETPSRTTRSASDSSLARVVLAAPASGQGKTTISVGVMAALTARGVRVAPAKVGPDFIDPGYHALATGRPGRNLDPWLQDEGLLAPLLLHGALTPEPADVAIIEGVMGLFDGRLGTDGFASTAHVARVTRTPVVLVVDISSASRSVAATVHGLRTYDPELDVAGVILNKSGSDRHATEVRRSCEQLGIPVLGVFPRDADVSVPSRHLGLVPAAERREASDALLRLTEQSARYVDLDGLLDVAGRAPALGVAPWSPPGRTIDGPRPRVAVAGGRAFTFRYAETDEFLRAQGLEPVVFDPIRDRALPDGTAGLYLGGGFPEVHAQALAGNTGLLTELRSAVMSGLPTVAECAGMLYLLRSVNGHRFAGAIEADAVMSPRLTLGYREASAPATLLTHGGEIVRGHEFHRTVTTPGSDARDPAWAWHGATHGFSLDPAGTGQASLHASYLHTHWAGFPDLGLRFAQAVHRQPSATSLPVVPPSVPTPVVDVQVTDPATFHGDQEVGDDLVDFAVNVRAPHPPSWVSDHLAASLSGVGSYPRTEAAREAVAAQHGVDPGQVLLTNGAAEAFTLIARALRARRPAVVHPQFGEPDVAFRRAGTPAASIVVRTWAGEQLTSERIPADVDVVVIGNPGNPTGALHPAATLTSLRRPGRTVVVDEAFMDLVPGESTSLIDGSSGGMDGVLVVRSLTKTWSLAGLRVGYVVGDATLIARLAAQQPHWSVNSLAAEAAVITSTRSAQRQVRAWAEESASWRRHLVDGLRDLGCHPMESAAPFVTVRVGPGVHAALRARGYATRRCETFPGLGPDWIRLAVRDPVTTDGLLRSLGDVLRDARRETTHLESPPHAGPTRPREAKLTRPGHTSSPVIPVDTPIATPPTPAGSARTPLSGRDATAATVARPSGSVVLVGAGPGDPALLTVRGRDEVRRADVVVHDRLIPHEVLGEAREDAEIIAVGKIPRGDFTPQQAINELLVERARRGHRVVRLKGGDSYVFGRGSEEVRACAEAGVSVEVVPGVTSAVAVPGMAGIPLTDRALTQGFTVVSGHVPPGDPRSTVNWASLATGGLTLVLLMGLQNLAAIIDELTVHGLDPATPASCVANGTTAAATTVSAPVSELAAAVVAAGIEPPAITVIGEVVSALDTVAIGDGKTA